MRAPGGVDPAQLDAIVADEARGRHRRRLEDRDAGADSDGPQRDARCVAEAAERARPHLGRNRGQCERGRVRRQRERRETAAVQSGARRSRSAFAITETEERLIAAAAIIGESSRPNTGYSTPAATGTPSAL